MKSNMNIVLFVVAIGLLIVTGPLGLQDTGLANAADYAFQVTGGPSTEADISDDGRYVVFQSVANDLVDNDTNGVQDIFVHDRDADANGVFDEQDKPGGVSTIRISVTSDGTPAAGGDSTNPAISDNGRFVVFQSAAHNLVANDTNGVQDIFVHDRDVSDDGTFDEPGDIATARVSVDSSGNAARGGHSEYPDISNDGRYVAFQSLAHNLVNGIDNPGLVDIFIHDTQTGNTALINVDSNGNAAAGGNSTNPDISYDGRYIVFQSDATNLLGPGNDTNGVQDIFLHDRDTDEDLAFDEPGTIATIRVSVDSNGNPAAGSDSTNPAISNDKRHVVFQSDAHNLVDDDTNGLLDIFTHDRDVHDDKTFDELGDIATVRISVRTVELSSSDGNLTAASSSGGSGGGGSCFIATAGHESPEPIVWLLLSVLLVTGPLLQWKSGKNLATHKR
jgi:Tol biopolymer transport system component